MNNKVLPHDLEAEESVLGALLNSRAMVEVLAERLVPGDFYSPGFAFAFAAICRLFENGNEVDALTVAREIEALGAKDKAPDVAKLISLSLNVPSASSAPRYAEIIMQHSLRRRLIGEATELEHGARDLTLPPGSVMEQHEARLAAIDTGLVTTDPDDTSVEEFVNRPQDQVGKWVQHALIRRRHKLMVVGGEGSGKSSVLRFCAICGAYGIQPWRHTLVAPLRTLICDFENPEDALYDSFVPILKTAQRHTGVDIQDVTDRLWWRPDGVNLRNRADLARFERVIRERRPDLVCVGPLYAMYDTDPKDFSWETAAKALQNSLKKLMYRYDFALMIEDHAPQDRSGGMRPYGSSYWRRWPEIGLGLEPLEVPLSERSYTGEVYDDRFRLNRWRGERVPTDWPKEIIRGQSVGSQWYFEGAWGGDTFVGRAA